MTIAHILGFPRIGKQREMKRAVESYWAKKIDSASLEETGAQLRRENWTLQKAQGLDFVNVGDFSWYDHMLDMAAMLGVVPERYGKKEDEVSINTYFRMARGRAPEGEDVPACEMTKWFDTNYHYIVPELNKDQTFKISSSKLFNETKEAKSLGFNPKPMVVGPLTFLFLAKGKDAEFNKLDCLDTLLPAYVDILNRLADEGAEWVQIDEPILTLELDNTWQKAYRDVYAKLESVKPKLLLTTYFGDLDNNLELACQLPTAGLHIDCVRGKNQVNKVLDKISDDKVLSLGVINGRNIWRADLSGVVSQLEDAKARLGQRLWVGSSCSLLHVPVDLDFENKLDGEIKSWLSFAKQKVEEIATVRTALVEGRDKVSQAIMQSDKVVEARKTSAKIHNPQVQDRMRQMTPEMAQRHSAYHGRAKAQKALNLPLFPTTTIGSFPQTKEIRALRRDLKKGAITQDVYNEKIAAQVRQMVKVQEELELDVLVHGEPERNDMVEYFGELMSGYAFTENGWVQSYGSRCVKPPVIYGDVSRPEPMTVEWSKYAQEQTTRVMKGMLTGPVTMLFWSFVRDDQPRQDTCMQIALALRDELVDLEKNGIRVIQVDEPAFREGLPLKRKDWPQYLEWAVNSFRVATAGVEDSTQVHTHMCYSEFNDVIESIAALDADVITIETSRSQMELLQAFENFSYPNEIGPGVYDIHSPRVPSVDEMVNLLESAVKHIPQERLWVNPDCGLKTRDWPETKEALANMVQAAKIMRDKAK